MRAVSVHVLVQSVKLVNVAIFQIAILSQSRGACAVRCDRGAISSHRAQKKLRTLIVSVLAALDFEVMVMG
jgi:hypothetical protein